MVIAEPTPYIDIAWAFVRVGIYKARRSRAPRGGGNYEAQGINHDDEPSRTSQRVARVAAERRSNPLRGQIF
jgi:hypothetical protein